MDHSQSADSDMLLNGQESSRTVSDLHLDHISHHCCAGGVWKALASHLEIERSVVEDIDRRQVNDEEKRSNFFHAWKQTKGSEASYKRLVKALLEIRRKLDAEKVIALIQDQEVSAVQGTLACLQLEAASWEVLSQA